MNNIFYWIIRNLFLKIKFLFKTFFFRVATELDSNKFVSYSKRHAVKFLMYGIIKCIFIAILLLQLDKILILFYGYQDINTTVLVSVIICGISVAGIIIGLYSSSISSVYSTRYANAPDQILNAFQNDLSIRKSLNSIIQYITFGFIVIIEILYGFDFSWATVIGIILWSIYVIFFYSLTGKRVYALNDSYKVSDDAFTALEVVINKIKNNPIFSLDENFQNHFLKIALSCIDLMKSVQKHCSDLNNKDNTSMIQFMSKINAIINSYWKAKSTIVKDSIWFKNGYKHKKWHIASESEASVALATGTPLKPEVVRNNWWFEKELFNINRLCVKELIRKEDFASLLQYLYSLNSLCKTAIESKEINYYLDQINWINAEFENYNEKIEDKEALQAYYSVVEYFLIIYLNELIAKLTSGLIIARRFCKTNFWFNLFSLYFSLFFLCFGV